MHYKRILDIKTIISAVAIIITPIIYIELSPYANTFIKYALLSIPSVIIISASIIRLYNKVNK